MSAPALKITQTPASTVERLAAPSACAISDAEVDASITRRRKARGTAGLLAALGIACAACLIPGLAIGGAGIFAAGAIGADTLLMGAVALALASYGIYRMVKQRSRSAANPTDTGCGC